MIFAQDIEPRRWSHLPSNYSVVGAGYVNTRGDILFDPALLIEDAKVEMDVVALSYVHAFDWLGKTARVDYTLPYVQGLWTGLLNGELASARRSGFADPIVRFSVNLYGAPALKGKEFGQFYVGRKRNTIVGVALGVRIPLGQYSSERLINLGSNRWTIRPQIGVVRNHGFWSWEATGSVFLYSDNDEFFRGSQLQQDPLWALQTHVIKTFSKGSWASLSTGYGWGAQTKVNGQKNDDPNGNWLWALSFGMPINRQQSLKLAYLKFSTQKFTGTKSDALTIAYSYAWGRK